MTKPLLETFHSLTLDNGVEFALHERISRKIRAVVYFCEPYKSYQKGAIENANRLIRQAMPKRFDINSVTQSAIDKIIAKKNNRPMKCLGFKTPAEVFEDNLLKS